MRIFYHYRPKFDVCLSIDARLIYAKPSSSDACEFPKGLLQRFVNEIKVYPENTFCGFVFFCFFFQMRTVWLSILSFLESYLKLEEIINTVFVDTRVYIRNSRSFQ